MHKPVWCHNRIIWGDTTKPVSSYAVECPTKEECDEMLSYLERQNKTADIVERAIDYGGILAAFMICAFVARIMIGV